MSGVGGPSRAARPARAGDGRHDAHGKLTVLILGPGGASFLARRIQAAVVVNAEPGGVVLSGDIEDLGALTSHSDALRIERICALILDEVALRALGDMKDGARGLVVVGESCRKRERPTRTGTPGEWPSGRRAR